MTAEPFSPRLPAAPEVFRQLPGRPITKRGSFGWNTAKASTR